ncbi:hypothetical protein MMC26_003209 [Xylographa opegraphella]|nr:hypothetical protein [Xylographa opegraphella]
MALLLDTNKEEKTKEPQLGRRNNLKLFNDWVTLVVGPEKKIFKMHMGLLCSVSPYFKAALEGDFKEAQEQVIELTEDDSEIIEYFQFWLYTQSILDEDETMSHIEWEILVGLYVLGDSRLIVTLQNHVMDLLLRNITYDRELPEFETIYGIYEKTCPASLLRRFIVEASARHADLDTWEWNFVDGVETAQRDFLKDLVLEVDKDHDKRQERDLWKIRCSYHIHTEGEARCSEDTPNPYKVRPKK